MNSRWYIDAEEAEPDDGDFLHVVGPEHASVLLRKLDCQHWETADYGQPHGRKHVCRVDRTLAGTIVRGRRLAGFVSLERMVRLGALVESAIVPDSFDMGIPDDNPYWEDLPIPAGVRSHQ